MKTMQEVRAEREEQVLQTKLASVQEAFGDNQEVLETLSHAIDLVKEAGVEDPCEALDIACQLVVDHYSSQEGTEKVASSEDLEVAFNTGIECAEIAHGLGITLDEIEKIASEEEADAFGRMLAQALIATQE